MSIFSSLGLAILWLVWLPLMVAVLYLLLLMIAAAMSHSHLAETKRQHSFRIVVPAHNEELVLEPVLRHLLSMRYPSVKFEVVVVADNCVDKTAEVARNLGIRVLERNDPTQRGKGYALAYAFSQLQDELFDAYVVLDADSLVDPDFLAVLNRYLVADYRVMMVDYDVLNPFENQRTALMYVSLRIWHYVRPLGRCTIGASTSLAGNGMCFVKNVIDRYPWNAYSLTEDIEYTKTLLHHNERIMFAPEAHIYSQMPVDNAQAASQRMRWESGRFQFAREYGFQSLWYGLSRHNLGLFDWGMDLLIPPLATLVLAVGCGTVLAGIAKLLGIATIHLVWAWTALLIGLAVFVFGSLLVAHVPMRAYVALINAPRYLIWKLWVYAQMLMYRGPRTWIRTGRRKMSDD